MSLPLELFKNCNVRYCMPVSENDLLLQEIKKKLAEDLKFFKTEFNENAKKEKYYWSEFRDRERIRRIRELLEYFEKSGSKTTAAIAGLQETHKK